MTGPIPPELGQLTNLDVLALGDDIGITFLDLIGNRLTETTYLTSLEPSDNQLTVLPAEIGQLTNLTYLDLGGNELTSIPPEIGQLTNLASLYLQNNTLTVIPPNSPDLPNSNGWAWTTIR